MLAQNFKTPNALGISDAEFDALLKVLGMLERGELRHGSPDINSVDGGWTFNMSTVGHKQPCGTVACIGGWACVLMDRDIPGSMELYNTCATPALRELYFPTAHLMNDITPAQAALALRSYLTAGDPKWDEALSQT